MAEQAEDRSMRYFQNIRLRTDLGQGTKRSYFHDVLTKCAGKGKGMPCPHWWRCGALIVFGWHIFVFRVLQAGRGLLQGDKEEFNERLQEAYASLEFTRIQVPFLLCHCSPCGNAHARFECYLDDNGQAQKGGGEGVAGACGGADEGGVSA